MFECQRPLTDTGGPGMLQIQCEDHVEYSFFFYQKRPAVSRGRVFKATYTCSVSFSLWLHPEWTWWGYTFIAFPGATSWSEAKWCSAVQLGFCVTGWHLVLVTFPLTLHPPFIFSRSGLHFNSSYRSQHSSCVTPRAVCTFSQSWLDYEAAAGARRDPSLWFYLRCHSACLKAPGSRLCFSQKKRNKWKWCGVDRSIFDRCSIELHRAERGSRIKKRTWRTRSTRLDDQSYLEMNNFNARAHTCTVWSQTPPTVRAVSSIRSARHACAPALTMHPAFCSPAVCCCCSAVVVIRNVLLSWQASRRANAIIQQRRVQAYLAWMATKWEVFGHGRCVVFRARRCVSSGRLHAPVKTRIWRVLAHLTACHQLIHNVPCRPARFPSRSCTHKQRGK